MQDFVKLEAIDLSAYVHLVPRDRDAQYGKGDSIDRQPCLLWHCSSRLRLGARVVHPLLRTAPDVVVTENESMWQVAETGWIYVVGDANRAGKALLTLLVDHLEDHVAELRQRGLIPAVIDKVPGLYRKAVNTDPDGNMISLGEDLSTVA